jgi:hypothetical protein
MGIGGHGWFLLVEDSLWGKEQQSKRGEKLVGERERRITPE